VHTTPKQCLMSITAIAHQAQGMRVGEVIAKLAEDAYFMRVDNRVTQAPPSGTATTKPQAAVRTSVATILERSYQLTLTVPGQRPVDPLKVATTGRDRPSSRPWRQRQWRRELQPWSWQEGRWRRRSRRPRPREQPCFQSLTWRLRRPPEN
jgi:hypothetical protein